MPTGIRAVLFDFDGVIVNSEPLHFLAFNEVLKHENIDLSEQEYYGGMIGFDDRGAFKHIYQVRNIPLEPRVLLRLLTLKSEMVMDLIHKNHYAALPGAAEFVRSLWRDYPLGICSGGLREEIEAMLEGVSLRDCFRTIVSAEDVAVGKPDPSGYLLATKLIGEKINHNLRPEQCLVVEDAPTVIRSVKKAGFPTLAVATTYPLDKLIDATYTVKSLHPQEVKKKIPNLKLWL